MYFHIVRYEGETNDIYDEEVMTAESETEVHDLLCGIYKNFYGTWSIESITAEKFNLLVLEYDASRDAKAAAALTVDELPF